MPAHIQTDHETDATETKCQQSYSHEQKGRGSGASSSVLDKCDVLTYGWLNEKNGRTDGSPIKMAHMNREYATEIEEEKEMRSDSHFSSFTTVGPDGF